jgi:sec-independent protein translocase protein TatB
VFSSLGWGEMSVLLVLGLFVFGPDRLPDIAAEAGRWVRKARTQLKGMTDDLKSELGPEVGDLDLASLHPRTFLQKHLFEDDPDEGAPPVRRTTVLAPGETAPWDPDTT